MVFETAVCTVEFSRQSVNGNFADRSCQVLKSFKRGRSRYLLVTAFSYRGRVFGVISGTLALVYIQCAMLSFDLSL